MKTAIIKNFHLPLSEPFYQRLKDAARRQKKPATQLVKEAVEYWLEEQEKLALHEEIAEYAAQTAGAKDDLDEMLENTGLELLADGVKKP